MRSTAVLLLAGAVLAGRPDARSQVKPLTLELVQASPSVVAKVLRKKGGLRVAFAPQAVARRANVALKNVPTVNGIETIADHFRCEARFLGKKRWRIAPAWMFAIEDKLEAKPNEPWNLSNVKIASFLDAIRTGADVDVVLHPKIDRDTTVTLRAGKLSYRKALDRVVKKHRLAWELRYGVLYVADKEKFKAMPVLVPALQSTQLLGVQLPMPFGNTTLERVIPHLEERAKKPMEFPDEAKAWRVDVVAKEVSLAQALALLLYPHATTAIEQDKAVVSKPLKQK